jgi:hypothetical protein
MNIIMRELFSIKKAGIKKKVGIKKLGIKKLGILAIIFLFGICTFISGRISVAKADGSISTLPISRGGTGANSASGALDNLGKINSVDSNSTDEQFPSAKGVYNWGSPTIGIDNFYMQTKLSGTTPQYVFFIGELPTETRLSKIYTSFIGEFLATRLANANAWPGIFDAKIDIVAGYSNENDGILASVVPTINDPGGMTSNFPVWQLGKFTYDSKLYIGMAMTGNTTFWNIDYIILKGFYKGTLPSKCETAADLCVGKKMLYDQISDWTKIWPTT